jgi:carbon monoxide dehydrogenase subunit G
MLIENAFPVAAEPDQVFEFLQDAHNVATCFRNCSTRSATTPTWGG